MSAITIGRSARRALALAAASLLALAVGAGTASAADGDRYTPLVPSVESTPRWFQGADGRAHLVYELELVNGFPVPVTLASVTVRAAGRGGARIQRLTGASLTAATSLAASGGTPTTTIPASAVGVVWFDISFADARAIPARIEHTVVARGPKGLPVPRVISFTGAPARVDRRPPVVLGAPLTGTGWGAFGSCCDGPHRRALQPVDGALRLGQRFAIDFNRLDTADRLVTGDPALNESYPTFDQPVIAVADATVARVADRYPDQVPNAPTVVGLAAASGNHVILNLGRGRYAAYDHLKRGSIVVRPGQRVTKGQVLGLTGNSGSSSGPHLHFQVMDAPSSARSEGLPYVFETFDLQGRTPPLDDALFSVAITGAPISVTGGRQGIHRNELPLGRDVVTFP